MKPDVRDRLVLPLLIPLGLLAIIAIIAIAFGMLLFFNPMTVSLTIAIVVAAAVLAAFGLASSASEADLTNAKRAVIALAGVLPLVIGALVAFDVVSVADDKVSDRECEYCVPADAIEVVAQNIEWVENEIVMPAESEVSILFRNQDAGTPHNVAIYPEVDEQPAMDQPVFQGETFNGVAQRVYTFQSPPAGTYFYVCDVHPNMVGVAVVGETDG